MGERLLAFTSQRPFKGKFFVVSENAYMFCIDRPLNSMVSNAIRKLKILNFCVFILFDLVVLTMIKYGAQNEAYKTIY